MQALGVQVGALRPRGKGELADPGARVGDPPQVLVSFEAVDVHGAHLFWEETVSAIDVSRLKWGLCV